MYLELLLQGRGMRACLDHRQPILWDEGRSIRFLP